jgi:hypothetical protein
MGPETADGRHEEGKGKTERGFFVAAPWRFLTILSLWTNLPCHFALLKTNSSPAVATKGQPDPVKAKVHATRTKQMVLAFFNNKGLIYANYVLRGTTVNARYIVEALGKFMKIFMKKRAVMAARDWMFH